MDKIEENAIPWIEDALAGPSTDLPEVILEDTTQLGTLIIFVVSAILAITLLFIIAIFIDCRQEKLAKMQQANKPRRVLKIRMPKVLKKPNEERDGFANKMHTEEDPGPSNSISVIV